MTPVEELRSAAALLRQRAEAATAGPWRREYPEGPNTTVVDYADVMIVAGVTAREIWPKPVDADYIATVHPLVGLALAGLLEHMADDMDDDRAEEAQIQGGPKAVRATFPASNWRWDWTAALALARLLLGGDS